MANKKNIKLAAQIAVVAGIFTLVVAFMFLINYVNIRQNDPIDNVALEVLVERLSEDAHNDALIEDIRNLDLIARKAFFTGHWQIDVGSWLLLIGAMVTALALRLYFSWSGKIEKPQSDEIKPAVQRLISQRWIAGAGFVVVLLAFMSSFGSDNYLSKYDLPLRTGVVVNGIQNKGIKIVDVNPDSDTEPIDSLSAKQEVAVVQEPEEAARKIEIEKNKLAKEAVDLASKEDVIEKAVVMSESAEPLKAEKPVPDMFPDIEEVWLEHSSFRGPLGQGHSRAKNIPEKWDVEAGEMVKWKTEIPVSGYNSPVIWKDKIFLSGADAEQRIVYAIDRQTGKIVWQHVADNIPGSPESAPKVTDDTGLAAPTLVTDGQRIVAIFGTGDILALKMDGTRLWAKNLGVPDNHYGHSSSLLCLREKVFVQYDTNDGGRVICLNVLDGAEIWNTERSSGISWASPVLAELNGTMQLLLSSVPNVSAYDIATGKELWSVECMMGEVGPSLGVGGGYVYAANEYATLCAIDPVSASIVWEDNEYLPEVASPVYADGLLFIATTYGVFVCYDAKTGTKLWEEEFDNGFYSSPMIADGKIYIVDMEGVVHVMKAEKEAQLISNNVMGEPIMSTPAFSDAALYLRSKNTLYCIGE